MPVSSLPIEDVFSMHYTFLCPELTDNDYYSFNDLGNFVHGKINTFWDVPSDYRGFVYAIIIKKIN